MKKLLLCLGAVLCLLDSHAQTTNTSPEEGITNVLRARAHLYLYCSKITIEHGKITNVQLHEDEYSAALSKIDPRDCPRDFQVAWFDYQKAWEKKVRTQRSDLITLGLTAFLTGGSTLPEEVFKLVTDSEPNDVLDKWTLVQRSALLHGIDAQRIRF